MARHGSRAGTRSVSSLSSEIMALFVLFLALAMPIALALAFAWLRSRRHSEPATSISPVSRQHFELLQGSEINPRLIEATKRRFQAMLERGDDAAVEARLRPGEDFVVQVRALTELGTDAAGRILERQLERRLSKDHLEQTWYRIDLATGLRQLNRSESLPHLLRCVDDLGDAPVGPVFAAETFCFLGFGGYLKSSKTRLGRAALNVTRRVLEGFRLCLPPHVVVEGRLGEMIETIWDQRRRPAEALVVRVLHETVRTLHRMPAALALLEDEPAEGEAFRWQMSRLESIEPAIIDYLAAAKADLLAQLPAAQGQDLRDLLLALIDLRAEAAGALLPLLKRDDFPELELAFRLLRWSNDSDAGVWLRAYGRRHVDLIARANRRPPLFGARHRIPPAFPYSSLLVALRGQMSSDSEDFLIAAAADRDPQYRLAAVSSLGWWDPAHHVNVIQRLEEARRDTDADVRRAARAALARLGERSALQWFRQALNADVVHVQHEAIQFIASEGLTLLWPDLDRLIDSEHSEIAHHAREALAIMSEDMAFTR